MKDKRDIVDITEFDLTPKQMEFCQYYIYDWNATRAYMKAYDTDNNNMAAVEAHKLLRKPNIKEYIEHLQTQLEKIANISRLKVLKEHIKIAFSDTEEEEKIRVPDKQKSLESIAKMMGYDAPININLKNEISTKPTIIIGDEGNDGLNENTREVQESI